MVHCSSSTGEQGANKYRMTYTKHHAGSPEGLVQRCILCGEAICDYTNAMGEGQWRPAFWEEGEIYVSVSKNPTITITSYPEGDIVLNCL